MKIKVFMLLIAAIVVSMFTNFAAATPPTIDIALPFDIAPIIAAVLALAVVVLIAVAGPKISLQFGKKALRSIGGIFKG